MTREPLLTIGAVFTSLKLAVTAVVGVLVIAANLPEGLSEQIILASGLVVLSIGDILGYYLTHSRVTPTASPNLPVGTVVNRGLAGPDAVVAENAPPRGNVGSNTV